MRLYLYMTVIGLGVIQPASSMLDENGNGMSDVWERKYQVVGANPLVDLDGDGQNNLAESMAGTDPGDIQSVLSVMQYQRGDESVIAQWPSKTGVHYRVERTRDLGQPWEGVGEVLVGNGSQLIFVDEGVTASRFFYRIQVLPGNRMKDLPVKPEQLVGFHDTDGDSISDIQEVQLGLDPFDQQSGLPSPIIEKGGAVELEWNSIKGKHYQLQELTQPGGVWVNIGTAYPGSGEQMSIAVKKPSGTPVNLRVIVQDVDTDGDGLTDWEELQVGLNIQMPKTNTLGSGDMLELQSRMAAPSSVEVKASQAVANLTRMKEGGFLIQRSGGLDTLTVMYSMAGSAVAGSDYVALSGSVTIPFGQDSVVIPVIPLADSSVSLSESVVLNLLSSQAYDLGSNQSQQVNVIKEVAINVRAYGATGDGVTDDTIAIQSAIEALELSSSHNTLHFPAGRYRLNQAMTTTGSTGTSSRILRFGVRDLAGRDIVFTGNEGAVLFSTVSPTRAHMLEVFATFRSLSFVGLNWEKDSAPLDAVAPGAEPNGAAGVALKPVDLRVVEHVVFQGCQLDNCHPSILVTGHGYDLRGRLKKLGIYDSLLLNPYGANTINSQQGWGGGQQTIITQWIGDAIYLRSRFEGGGVDMSDGSTSPGGRLKDAAVIGGPLRLIFAENTVMRMGVEAVFNNGRSRWMNSSDTAVVIPPDDGVSVANVRVKDFPTTFVPGQLIHYRTQTTQGQEGVDNFFRVTGYDPVTRNLSFVNDGHHANAAPGTSIARSADIYLDSPEPRQISIIENNVISGTFPPGADYVTFSAGITMNTLAKVRGNVISDYSMGVMSYTERMRYPWSRGLLIDSNVIKTRQRPEETPWTTMAVRSGAKDQIITNNIILMSVAERTVGVAVYGDGSLMKNNFVVAQKIIRHEYDSPLRSLGLGMGNGATNTVFDGNYTYGLDRGLGALAVHRAVPYYVISHYSVNDTLPVDPRGVIRN